MSVVYRLVTVPTDSTPIVSVHEFCFLDRKLINIPVPLFPFIKEEKKNTDLIYCFHHIFGYIKDFGG